MIYGIILSCLFIWWLNRNRNIIGCDWRQIIHISMEGMVEIEVRGAHNVLEACAQAETTEKVVFTSPVCAMI